MYRELGKVTLMDMPHYSRFLSLQRKGLEAQGTIGSVRLNASFILSLRHHWMLTPWGCRHIMWVHTRGLQSSPKPSGLSLSSKPSLLSPTLRVQSTPAPRPQMQAPQSPYHHLDHSPSHTYQGLHGALLAGDVCPGLSLYKKGRNNFPFLISQKSSLPRCFWANCSRVPGAARAQQEKQKQ